MVETTLECGAPGGVKTKPRKIFQKIPEPSSVPGEKGDIAKKGKKEQQEGGDAGLSEQRNVRCRGGKVRVKRGGYSTHGGKKRRRRLIGMEQRFQWDPES